MSVFELTASESEPLTLVEAKLVCAEDGNALDAVFSNVWIPAARQMAEARTGRALISRKFRQVFDGFCNHGMILERSPLISVEAVNYSNGGPPQVLGSAEYQAGESMLGEGIVLPASGGAFPSATQVAIEFTAGYGKAVDVPASIKQWMLMLVSTWYQQREGVVTGTIVAEVPRDFMLVLLDPYMAWRR